MNWQDLWTVLFAVPGCFFVTMGTVGLLRLRDLHCRIHALTKADTLGLGFLVLAIIPQAESVGAVAKLILIWALALFSASLTAYLLARGVPPQYLVEGARDGAGPTEGSDR